MLSDRNATVDDRLRELGNVGCSRALTALEQMTSEAFSIRVPTVELVDYADMPARLGDPASETVSVALDVRGELDGMFLTLMQPDTAARLLAELGVDAPRSFRELNRRQRSALLELGNILCCSYMTAVSEMTGLTIRFSVPTYAVDMLGAVLSLPMIRWAEAGSKMLYIKNVFAIRDREMSGAMLFLPETDDVRALSERLGGLL